MLNSEFVADLFVYIFPSAGIFGASGEEESVRYGGCVLRWVRLEPSPRSRGGTSVLLEGGGSFSPSPNPPLGWRQDSTVSVGFIFGSLRFRFFVSKTKQKLAFYPRGQVIAGWVTEAANKTRSLFLLQSPGLRFLASRSGWYFSVWNLSAALQDTFSDSTEGCCSLSSTSFLPGAPPPPEFFCLVGFLFCSKQGFSV